MPRQLIELGELSEERGQSASQVRLKGALGRPRSAHRAPIASRSAEIWLKSPTSEPPPKLNNVVPLRAHQRYCEPSRCSGRGFASGDGLHFRRGQNQGRLSDPPDVDQHLQLRLGPLIRAIFVFKTDQFMRLRVVPVLPTGIRLNSRKCLPTALTDFPFSRSCMTRLPLRTLVSSV